MFDVLHSGALYYPLDGEITEEQTRCLEKLYDYNHPRPGEGARREAMLRDMFAAFGEGSYIEPPLHANWGGRFVHFGKNVYANFGLTLVDDTHIYVGDACMFGPNVVIATAGHPILPALREQGLQYNAPVRIGNNCWLGAGALVTKGTKIPPFSLVVGAPAKVIRTLEPSSLAERENQAMHYSRLAKEHREALEADARED